MPRNINAITINIFLLVVTAASCHNLLHAAVAIFDDGDAAARACYAHSVGRVVTHRLALSSGGAVDAHGLHHLVGHTHHQGATSAGTGETHASELATLVGADGVVKETEGEALAVGVRALVDAAQSADGLFARQTLYRPVCHSERDALALAAVAVEWGSRQVAAAVAACGEDVELAGRYGRAEDEVAPFARLDDEGVAGGIVA